MFRYRSARPAFTVIEVVVVMLLIAVLAGLSLAAYFRAQASFKRKETEDIASKLQSQMDTQWKAVIDNCKDDARNNSIPANVVAMAGNDSRRALIMWTKMKQRYEFPQTLDDAVVWPQQAGFLELKPTYKRLFDPVSSGYAPPNPRDAFAESAILLYLTVTQSRRGAGAGFSPNEQLGQHALGKLTYGTVKGAPAMFDVFVDVWGQPIAFVRWPTFASNPASAYQSDLNAAPYWTLNAQTNQPVDPLDPENTLYDQSWRQLPATVLTGSGTLSPFNAFNTYVHPLRPLGNPLTNAATGPVNLSPVIVSAGPPGSKPTGTLTWDTAIQSGQYGPAVFGLNADFSVSNPGAEPSNIYGYRVRRMAQQGDK
jgi:type II secretory pathway pseudopilin PulG